MRSALSQDQTSFPPCHPVFKPAPFSLPFCCPLTLGALRSGVFHLGPQTQTLLAFCSPARPRWFQHPPWYLTSWTWAQSPLLQLLLPAALKAETGPRHAHSPPERWVSLWLFLLSVYYRCLGYTAFTPALLKGWTSKLRQEMVKKIQSWAEKCFRNI